MSVRIGDKAKLHYHIMSGMWQNYDFTYRLPQALSLLSLVLVSLLHDLSCSLKAIIGFSLTRQDRQRALVFLVRDFRS